MKTTMNALNLYQATSPLRKATAVNTKPRILLVDSTLKGRNSNTSLPALPPSFKGVLGQRIELLTKGGTVIVVGCGQVPTALDEGTFWESAGAAVVDSMRALKLDSAVLDGEIAPVNLTNSVAAQRFCLGATLASYQCVGYRKTPPKDHLEVKDLGLTNADWKAGARGRDVGAAVNWARAMVDAPANLMTPQVLAREIKNLEALGVVVEIIDEAALKKLGAGGLLAVGRSSEHPPCMVVCRWNGRKSKEVDLGLVGKGLTFDAGGLNLKGRPGIEKMKFDMGGAAAVAGAMRVFAEQGTPLNVVAVLPLCENVIDGKSYRPGDVITSLSGLTIEVDNTDAEGRIVLADGITYLIDTFKPELLIDVATLTGAVMSALHEEFAGLFSVDEELVASLNAAATKCGEAVWRLPLSKRQDYLVDSEIADVKNVALGGMFGVGMGSSIGGAKFLERFVGNTRWAHLDIAGTAWATRALPGIARGATGYGVRLLDAFVDQLLSSRRSARK